MLQEEPTEGATQRSYLLRLWRTRETGALRATLLAVGAQPAPRHFVDLELLLAFLLDEWSPTPLTSPPHPTPDEPEALRGGEAQARSDTG